MLIRKKQALTLAMLLPLLMTGGCGMNKKESSLRNEGIELLNSGKYKEAAEKFDEALKSAGSTVDSEEVDIAYYKAASLYLSGDGNGAVNTITDLIGFDRKNADSYFLRGSYYADLKKEKQAESDFKKSIELKPSDYDRYIKAYYSMNSAGFKKSAKGFLDDVMKIKKASSAAYLAKGKVKEISGNNDKALSYYKKAFSAGSKEARLDMARVYSAIGDKDSAKKELQSYQKENKPSAESYNAIGVLQMQEKNYTDALKSIRAGLALKGSSYKKELSKNEILALEYSGNFKEAAGKCKEFVAKYPGEKDMAKEYKFLSTRTD